MVLDTANLSLDHVMDTDVRVLEQLEEGNLSIVTDWLKLRVIVDLDASITVV